MAPCGTPIAVPDAQGRRLRAVKKEKGFTLIELLVVVAIIGIIAAIAIPNLLMAIQRARQRRSMVDMRNIATAWEARGVDMGRYNAAAVGVGNADKQVDIAALSTALAPTYMHDVPQRDGWGTPYITFTDQDWATATKATEYAIISAGQDHVFAPTEVLGAFTDFDCDIIYTNGAFIAYPVGGGAK
jgi:type II secretion system protein G